MQSVSSIDQTQLTTPLTPPDRLSGQMKTSGTNGSMEGMDNISRTPSLEVLPEPAHPEASLLPPIGAKGIALGNITVVKPCTPHPSKLPAGRT